MTGYAVVDVQTTGLEPSMQHRVVEIGVVHVDEDGSLGSSWCTLINPQRDLGATDLHGITARDVLDAPLFVEVAPLVVHSLAGRTPVSHNAAFTLNFVAYELQRAGFACGASIPGIATMRYVHHIDQAAPRRLVDCCDHFGIPLARRYSSLHQADAVAALLQRLIADLPSPVPWMDMVVRARSHRWPAAPAATAASLRGREAPSTVESRSWIDRLMSGMPGSDEPETEAYLDMLEMALLDRYLSAHETDALVHLAWRLGLDREAAASLHRNYLRAMAKVAWADGEISQDEYAELASVAEALGLLVADVDAALAAAESDVGTARPASFSLEPGDAVCLTGTMSVPRERLEAAARAKGLEPGSLTKRTRLLVAADPDSLSGKARKARDYGVPIVNEECFRELLDGM